MSDEEEVPAYLTEDAKSAKKTSFENGVDTGKVGDDDEGPAAKSSTKRKTVAKKRASGKAKASSTPSSASGKVKASPKARNTTKAALKKNATSPVPVILEDVIEDSPRQPMGRSLTDNDSIERQVSSPIIREVSAADLRPTDAEPEPYDQWYIDLLKQKFPFQKYIDDTAHRGVSLQQLRRVREFTAKHVKGWRDIGMYSKTKGQSLTLATINLYQLNDWFIKPACLTNECAFVELVCKGVQTPTWFVSHWWGEPVDEFIMCVEKHVEVRGEHHDVTYWVCAYANRQHNLSQDLNADPRQTSFFRAMLLTKGVLLILDTVGPATPFKRVWCAFEEAVLMLEGGDRGEGVTSNGQGMGVLLDIVTTVGKDLKRAEVITDGLTNTDDDGNHHVGGPEQVKAQRERNFPIRIIKEGLKLELEKSEATNDDDRVHILNCLAGRDVHTLPVLESHENYTKINCRLRAIFAVAAWRQAIEDKHGSIAQDLGLSAVVSADIWRESLNLNFAFCKISDADMRGVAKGLPPALKRLTLDLRRCQRCGDTGLHELAEALPRSLESLTLTFTGCRKISTPCVVALANHLPGTLQILELNLYACASITNPAVAALSKALPQSLSKLYLNFSWCEQLTNPSAFVLCKYLPTHLHCMEILFRKTGVSDDIADAFHDLNFNDAEDDSSVDPVKVLEFSGDAPGKYVLIRTKALTTVSLDTGVAEAETVDAALGTKLEILEVKCDTRNNGCKIWGRAQETDKFKTWVLLLDVAASKGDGRWAAMENPKGDAPGNYVVLRDKTPVGMEAERVGDGVGKLDKGKVVKIVMVKEILKLKKVRGQVEKPAGWITLASTDSSQRGAVFIPALSDKLQVVAESLKPHRKFLKVGIANLMDKLKKKIPAFEDVEKDLEIQRTTEMSSAAIAAMKHVAEANKKKAAAPVTGKQLKLKGVVEKLHQMHVLEEEKMMDEFEVHGTRRQSSRFSHRSSRILNESLESPSEPSDKHQGRNSGRHSGKRLTMKDVVGHLKAIQEADEAIKQEAFLEAVDGGVDDIIQSDSDEDDVQTVQPAQVSNRHSVRDVMVHLKVLQDVDDDILHKALETVAEDEEEDSDDSNETQTIKTPRRSLGLPSVPGSPMSRSKSPRPSADDKNAVKEYFRSADMEGTGEMPMDLCKELLLNIFPGWPEAEMDDLLLEAPGSKTGLVKYGKFIDWLYDEDGEASVSFGAASHSLGAFTSPPSPRN